MRSVTLLSALSIALVLSGCGMLRHSRMTEEPADVQAVNAQVSQGRPVQAPPAEAASGGIETIPFQLGVSSATVEKLGRQHACAGGQGAGLISQTGPVEVYRMQCDGGKTFMARCELRQCKPM